MLHSEHINFRHPKKLKQASPIITSNSTSRERERRFRAKQVSEEKYILYLRVSELMTNCIQALKQKNDSTLPNLHETGFAKILNSESNA